MDGPLAGAELALAYMLADESFGAYAKRTAAGITRARVAEPILPALAAALWRSREGVGPRALAVVCEDDDAARALAESAAAFLPPDTAAFLPSRGAGWGSGLDPAPHLVGERHRALDALARGGLVAVSADALIERVDPPDRRPAPVELRLGEDLPFDDLVSALAAAGYERSDSVEERGQFSVRGGLVDVFPTTGREPVRVEFFGDQVERLSAFSAFTQRSLRDLDRVLIHPAAEYSGHDIEHSRWGRDDDGADVPEGLVPLGPELVARRGRGRMEPGRPRRRDRRGARRGGRPAARSRGPRRGYVGRRCGHRPDRVGASRSRRCRSASRSSSRRSGRRSRPSGSPRPRTSCAGWSRAGYRVLVCFAAPRRGPAHPPGRCAASRPTVPVPGGHGPDEAGVAFVVSAAAAGLRLARAARSRCCPPPSSSAAAARAGRPGSAAGRSRRSPTCAAATTSCTRTTASAASSGSTPRRSAASSATTSTSSSAATTASTCHTTSWRRSAATSAPTAARRRSPSSAARPGDAQERAPAWPCASWPASCSRSTPAARRRRGRRSGRTTSGWRGWRRRSRSTRPTTRASRSTP